MPRPNPFLDGPPYLISRLTQERRRFFAARLLKFSFRLVIWLLSTGGPLRTDQSHRTRWLLRDTQPGMIHNPAGARHGFFIAHARILVRRSGAVH